MLKAGNQILIGPLNRLFNTVLSSGTYPDTWCTGTIIPIYKSGDKENPSNYRGITVSNCLGKLFNTIINKRIVTYLETNKLLSDTQIGFRPGHRTTDHIFLLKTIIDKYKHQKKHVYACYVDLSRAFDTIWRDGLFYKLSQMHISSKIIKILQKMYLQLNSCIKIKGKTSKYFSSNIGTRQGCSLSASLFNIYLNDLPDLLSNGACSPVSIKQANINCLQYADDIVLLSETKNGLQNALNLLSSYCNKWKLTINTQKTKTMVFNSRKIDNQFTIGTTSIEQVNSYIYLGIMMTPSGGFNQNLKYLHNKASKALFSIKTTMRHMSSTATPVKVFLKLFDTKILPILTYSSELWGSYIYKIKPNTTLESIINSTNHLLEKLHLSFCKYILGVHRKTSNLGCLAELGRFPIIIQVIKKILTYDSYILNKSPNELLKLAAQYQKEISNNNHYTTNWYRLITLIQKNNNEDSSNNQSTYIKTTISNIKAVFCDWAIKELQNNHKLQLYSTIKKSYKLEKYLEKIQIFTHRQAVSKLRLSCHPFPIEMGRYRNIDKEDRICNLCNEGIGDEEHYLTTCSNPTIKTLQNKLINSISAIKPTLIQFPKSPLFIYIISFKDNDLLQTSAYFIYKILKTYKTLTT